ncbi:MAG: type II toxin-antitoxin system RelE/ParE family toxin [Campylobacterales bacterium]
MSYSLAFLPQALKEWEKLDNTIKTQFKKKLTERLDAPHVLSDKLSGFDNVYKIKLRTVGYRLANQVKDTELVVIVLAVGERDKDRIYTAAQTL